MVARARGTTEAGSRRRAQILRQAETLVDSHGFDDLTMEAISEAIGVAKSTLYHYFPQKEDVLFAIHEETMNAQIERLREIVAMPENVAARLRLAIRDHLRLIADHPGRVRVLMDSKRDKERPHRTEMAKLERTYLDELVQLIEAGIESGELRPLNARVAAEAILGMTQHARYWYRAGRPGGHQAVADELWGLVAGGLCGPD